MLGARSLSPLRKVCARRAPLTMAIAYIAPTLLLIFYWGAASTGLMRHCGHLLFVSTIVLGVWALSRKCAGESRGPGNEAGVSVTAEAGSRCLDHSGAGWRRDAVNAFLHPLCFGWRGFEVALVAFGTTLLNAWPAWTGPYGWSDGLALAAAVSCLFSAVWILWRASRAAFADETLTRSATTKGFTNSD